MSEIDRLQRKLIPVNIVVMILSLVAALSIFFAPLITIDLGKVTGELMATMENELDGNESSGEGGQTLDMSNVFGLIAKSTEGLKISVSAAGLSKFASSEEPAGQITAYVGDLLNKIEDDLFSVIAVTYLPQLAENYIPDGTIDTNNINIEALTGKLNAVFEAGNDEQIDAAISDFVDELQKQAVSSDGTPVIEDDMKATINEYIREFYDDAAEHVEGDVTLENFICVAISEMMNGTSQNPDAARERGAVALAASAESGEPGNGGQGETNSEEKIYTTYEEFLGSMLGGSESSESTVESLNSTLKTFTPYLQYAAYAMFGFGAIWLILFVFALFHLFLKNKRFTMWYVKLTGFYPCFIFGVLPLVLKSVLSTLLPAESGINIAAIFGAITSLSWISGICYLILWAVSIFWAFPIKHKIRKLRKNGEV